MLHSYLISLIAFIIGWTSNITYSAFLGAGIVIDYQLKDLTPGLINLILVISISSLIIATVSVMYVISRKKMNLLLRKKNEEVELSNKLLEKERDKFARELSDSERLYKMLLSSADDGVAFYNPDWSIRFANHAFFSLIGMKEDDYMKLSPEERDSLLLHPDDIGYTKAREKALKENGIFEKVIRIQHADGHYVTLSSKSVIIADDNNNPIGILLISRDVTQLENTRKELVIARNKAEESNRLKSVFLANISHEIRTPLNSIVGFANLLGDQDTAPETRKEYIAFLNHNTERLLQIINDIIDLSRLENSEIEIRYNPVRIINLLKEQVEYGTDLIERSGKSISFELNNKIEEGKDIIYSDEVWLRRVLRHLIDNAVKFTREGSIKLSASMAGTTMLFSLKDSGIGISKENMRTIFEQFMQETPGFSRPFEGLGIGLTLIKHVVGQMDGYLWVESDKGSGSEFFFTIPYRPVVTTGDEQGKEERPTGREKMIIPGWTDKTILVVDDNPDVISLFERILADTGVHVIIARSGKEAIKIVRGDNTPDLILIDLQMPEMGGMEALKKLRAIIGNIPIIAQTAYIFEEDENELIQAGFDGCLIKPIRKDKLYSKLSTFLGTN